MSWLTASFRQSGEDPMHPYVDPANQALADQRDNDLLQAKAQARAAGLLSSLTAEEQANVDPTRREAFGGVAARGFYGGLAKQAVDRSLANLHSTYEGKRQSVLSDALSQIQGEDQAAKSLKLQQQANENQREANRPSILGFKF